MALKRDCYKERVKSQFLPKVQELTKTSSLAAGLEPVFVENPCWEEALACVSRLCFSHLQQLLPECRLSAALVWLSVLVRRFLMWATATCGNSCCFRSVITRVFGFCLLWTEEKVADAAARSRRVCRSELGWQPPAPPTLGVSSCVWIQWHTGLVGCASELALLPFPGRSHRRVRCRRRALPGAPTGAGTRSWLRSTGCCRCSSLKAERAYNDYVRTRRRLGREVSSSAQRFAFGLEASPDAAVGGRRESAAHWSMTNQIAEMLSTLQFEVFLPYCYNSDKW